MEQDNPQNNSARSVRNELARIASEVALFLAKLAVAALFLSVDWGIKHLAAMALESPEGFAYKILALVLDVTFVGTAIIISVAGAFTVAAEFIASTYNHIKRLRGK